MYTVFKLAHLQNRNLEIIMGLSALRRVLISLFIAHLSVALISEEGREYCTGKGSICEAYNNVDRKCRDETGPKYYDCTCKSGWVPLQKA